MFKNQIAPILLSILFIVIFIFIIIKLLKILPEEKFLIPTDEQYNDKQNIINYVSLLESYCKLNHINICNKNNIFNNLSANIKCNGSLNYEAFYYYQNNDSIIFYRKYNPNIDYQINSDYQYNIGFFVTKDMIQYFVKDGSISYTNKVINSGKNISITGALIGGAIAGDAGSIIGSQIDANKLDNITIKHDETHTFVYYNENDVVKVIDILGTNFYTFILQLFPEKDYRYITNSTNNNLPNNDEENIKKRLNKVEQLFKDGIITEEEYSSKRADILNEL